MKTVKAILFANTDWYLFNFRLPLARTLRASGVDVLFVSPPGGHGERLREAGFRWQPLRMDRRSLNPCRELSAVAHLVRLYRRERPDVVHHFTIKCVVYGAIAACLAGVPVRIHSVPGLGYVFTNEDFRARLLRPVLRTLLRWALGRRRSRVILQNHDDAAAFRRAGLADRGRVRLIRGSGVDTTRFRPAADPVLSYPPTRVLLVARLLWDKGIAEYVEAASRLRGLPIRFLLAGAPDPGNPASIPQGQLDAWAAEGVVELMGQVDDMPALLARADIAVLPSYREGLPKSLIEAAACALPLIATDAPGCREVVAHGENGLMVPPRDAKALAAAILTMHENPQWARGLGRAARNRAVAEFDERIVISRTLDVYVELLSELEGESARTGPAGEQRPPAPLPAVR